MKKYTKAEVEAEYRRGGKLAGYDRYALPTETSAPDLSDIREIGERAVQQGETLLTLIGSAEKLTVGSARRVALEQLIADLIARMAE